MHNYCLTFIIHHILPFTSATNSDLISALLRKPPPIVSRQGKTNFCTVWRHWETLLCSSLDINPTAPPGRDPIPLLLLFARRYCTGTIAPCHLPVRSRTVEDAVRAICQTFSRMGTADPRLNVHGERDFRLTSLYRVWQRDDPPPLRAVSNRCLCRWSPKSGRWPTLTLPLPHALPHNNAILQHFFVRQGDLCMHTRTSTMYLYHVQYWVRPQRSLCEARAWVRPAESKCTA